MKLAKIQSRLAASLSAIGQVMAKILEEKGGGGRKEYKALYRDPKRHRTSYNWCYPFRVNIEEGTSVVRFK